ncbi:MAG: hypothetical protein A2X46_09575 [Lentisphaerae bacterium GWF2_57_35]|nr:MAG: hypothetical protein A2X46_09575 [Lentisphaerae bacterium GWF2_57_35]
MINIQSNSTSRAIRLSLCVWAVSAFGFPEGARAGHGPGEQQLVDRVVHALSKTAPIAKVKQVQTNDWVWVELKYQDEQYPLTIDVLGSRNGCPPRKVLYMLSVSGMNFQSTYFTPMHDNLAQFFRKHGYLVVGITARENAVPAGADCSPLAEWGLKKHKKDVRKIVDVVRRRLGLRYDLFGFSYAGATVLDYAASYDDRLDKVIVADLFAFDPVTETNQIQTALHLQNCLNQMIGEGTYVDDSLAQLKYLTAMATVDPDGDSGVPRALVGLPLEGAFTYDGLLHFWMIYSGLLAGDHTALSGLPRDWPLLMSTLSGTYELAADPLDDRFGFTYTDQSLIRLASLKNGSGIIPLALLRDVTATAAGSGSYRIRWDDIDERVVWVNSALGYGDQNHAAQLIRQGGNRHVSVSVIEGYGNADLLFSSTAEEDVWRLFLTR